MYADDTPCMCKTLEENSPIPMGLLALVMLRRVLRFCTAAEEKSYELV